VFLGAKSRKAIRVYLKSRSDNLPDLWITDRGNKKLKYMGLRSVIVRRSEQAGVRAYGLHAFRRQFAITMLRAGVDLATLARLMGHASLSVLMRYLKQLPEDMRKAHRDARPVDNSVLKD
jgi:site-specific recombinase XerD